MKPAVVARFGSLGEAESARSALQAAGIDAVLADDEIVALNWLYSNAVGGVKVLVAEEDEERAAAILSTDAMAPRRVMSSMTRSSALRKSAMK